MGCHGLMSSALQVAVFGVTLIGAGIAFAPRAGQGRVPVIAAICVLLIVAAAWGRPVSGPRLKPPFAPPGASSERLVP